MSTYDRARRRPGDVQRASPETGIPLAPALALVGLLIATVLTLGLLLNSPNVGGPTSSAAVAQPTPNPSVIVRPREEVSVKGTIAFAKAGRIWTISGTKVTQLPASVTMSSPAWAPDGTLYAIEHKTIRARSPYQGRYETYTLNYPLVVRMDANGRNAKVVKDGLYPLGGRDRYWFTWLLQPAVSPDGRNIALISDGPEPFRRDPTLSLMPVTGGRITNLNLPEQKPFGHSDPAWSPDGRQLAFTRNLAEIGQGQPRIATYNTRTRAFRDLSQPGYAQPSWSPDGRYIAAVRTTGQGRDVVILDATSGSEVARLTRDGVSFAPTWSPDGTQLSYLNLGDQGADLRIVTLQQNLQVASDKPLTEHDRLDSTSRPSWYIPASAAG